MIAYLDVIPAEKFINLKYKLKLIKLPKSEKKRNDVKVKWIDGTKFKLGGIASTKKDILKVKRDFKKIGFKTRIFKAPKKDYPKENKIKYEIYIVD